MSGAEHVRATGSLRTPETPFALAADEIVRGAFIAYGLFLATGPLTAWIAISVPWLLGSRGFDLGGFLMLTLVYVLPIALVISGLIGLAAVLLVGIPAALGLGRALRHAKSRWTHILTASALGLVVGLLSPVAGSIMLSTGALEDSLSAWELVAILGVLTAMACGGGWAWTMRLALRDDAAAGTTG